MFEICRYVRDKLKFWCLCMSRWSATVLLIKLVRLALVSQLKAFRKHKLFNVWKSTFCVRPSEHVMILMKIVSYQFDSSSLYLQLMVVRTHYVQKLFIWRFFVLLCLWCWYLSFFKCYFYVIILCFILVPPSDDAIIHDCSVTPRSDSRLSRDETYMRFSW